VSRKLLYLVNPISGTRRKSRLRELITQKTEAAGIPFEIADTRRDCDYSDLPRKIAEDGISDVIVCGGDGSVSTVVAHLLDTDIAIGVIPMGSGNGLALAAGIPKNIPRALDIIFRGQSDRVDGLMINGVFSCMMCGLGADARIAHSFALQKKRGLQTYIRLSLQHYFRLSSYPFTIRIGEREISTDAFFLVIANSNQFGNHVTIAPKASLKDGLIDFVIVRKMNRAALPFALAKQIAGVNPPQPVKECAADRSILYLQAPAATIINRQEAPLHIDGEPRASAPVIEIRVLPGAFRLLQPGLRQQPPAAAAGTD